MTTIVTVVIDDGRPDYLRQSIASLTAQSKTDWSILVNDSGDDNYGRILTADYPQFDRQIHHRSRRGLAGAIRSAWEAALHLDCDYILHCEGDFTYNTEVPLNRMAAILDANPTLSQLSLKRQPVNDMEIAAGGYMETSSDRYHQSGGYVSHTVNYTFNPHLVPHDVAELCIGEPGDGLERGFTDTLLRHGYHFGVYGRIQDPPRVTHIGQTRSQGWQV